MIILRRYNEYRIIIFFAVEDDVITDKISG